MILYALIAVLFVRCLYLKSNYLGILDLRSDENDYFDLALSLKHGRFMVSGTHLDEFRTPGYPLFISFLFRIFGYYPQRVLFVHVFLDMISTWLVYLIGNYLFGTPFGWIAALLYGLSPAVVYWSRWLLCESLFMAVFLLAFYLALQPGMYHVLLVAVLLAVCTYIKPGSIYLPVCFLPLFGWEAFMLAGTYFVLISPWLLRNYIKHGSFSMSSITGYNLLYYNVNAIVKIGAKIERRQQSFLQNRIQKKISIRLIKKHPIAYMAGQVRGWLRMLFQLQAYSGDPVLLFKNKFNLVNYIHLAFLVAGYMVALLGAAGHVLADARVLSMVLIPVYFMMTAGGVGSARYRIPMLPFIILLAMAWISS